MDSLWLTENEPAMYVRATFEMVSSSANMKTARITGTIISQGFMDGVQISCFCTFSLICPQTLYLT